VRVEAIRGLSFFPTLTAMAAVAAAADVEPADRFVSYVADAAFGANIAVWKPAYEQGGFVARHTPTARILESVLGLDKKAAEIAPHLAVLLADDPRSAEERDKAMQALVGITGGNPGNGRLVFERVCIGCHRVDGRGADLGPDLTQVGTRLPPHKLVESIVEPNAAVDDRYLSTVILTDDGRSVTGLVVSETAEELVIFDGKVRKTIRCDEIDERTKLAQSSMPDGLAKTLSPTEFLDLVEFLRALR
jgi:putative heme-binding domain-containing protein